MTEPAAESGYLDAARDCIIAVGWRRTTLTDIARRAGVSRMTIYRRWPDMQSLLGDLLVREWAGLLLDSGLGTGAEGATTRERLARGISAMVRAIRDNELFVRIVEVDPELLHPYLFQRVGRNQAWILQLIQRELAAGQRDGSVRSGNRKRLATTLLLACYGFVLSAHTFDIPTGALDAELTDLVERHLRP